MSSSSKLPPPSMPSLPSARFRVLGVPVEVHASFAIASAFLGYSNDTARILAWVAVAFACVLVHELGHALAARAFGRTARIELVAMGGLTYSQGAPLSTWQRCAFALAGPFAGFVLGGVVLLATFAAAAAGYGEVLERRWVAFVVDSALWISFGYGVLNLVPIPPLDGSHVVRALADRFFGKRADAVVAVVMALSLASLVAAAIVFRSGRSAFLLVWLGVSALPALRTEWLRFRERRRVANISSPST